MKKPTAKTSIQQLMMEMARANKRKQWFAVSELFAALPEYKVSTLIAAVKALASEATDYGYVVLIGRRNKTNPKQIVVEYRINPDYLEAVLEEERENQPPVEPAAPIIMPEGEVPADKLTVVEAGVSGRRGMVRWTREEVEQLAARAKQIRGEPANMKVLTAIQTAQIACFAPERRRKIVTLAQVQQVADIMNRKDEPVKVEAPVVEVVPPSPVMTMLEGLGVDLVSPAMAALGVASTPKLLEELGHRFTDAINQSVMNAISSPDILNKLAVAMVQQQVKMGLATKLPALHVDAAVTQAASTPRKQKVLIVGLVKPSNVSDVKESYGQHFDLRFYHPDENINKLRTMCQVDHIIVMASTISHHHEHMVQNVGAKYTKLHGKIGVLVDHLNHLIAAQVAAA